MNRRTSIRSSKRKAVALRHQPEKLRPEDFDGHTEFDRLTPEQRLMWLSQTVQFAIAARHLRPRGVFKFRTWEDHKAWLQKQRGPQRR